MRKLTAIFLCAALMLAFGAALASADEGEKVVRQLWQMFADKKWDQIEAMMSPAFQAVHTYGADNKAQEMKLLRNLNLGPYELSNFQTTIDGKVMLVTYKVAAVETIKGKRLTKTPAPRMSIFIKSDRGWQWLAHANLKVVPK